MHMDLDPLRIIDQRSTRWAHTCSVVEDVEHRRYDSRM
jgi:hypothetical protein